MATTLQKLKELSESMDLMQQELEELKEVKVAAKAMVDIAEIPEGNADEPLTLAGKLQKVPECFAQCQTRGSGTAYSYRMF